MKNVVLSIVVVAALTACGGDAEKKTDGAEQKAPPTSMVTDPSISNPDFEIGLDLVGKYQCITCHKIDEKLTGPAYSDVANKYAGADDAKISDLATKIIAGGSGVWGEVPMTPHPNVTQDEAKAMVKYILLLKK